jgi:hypothetical protein
VGIVRSVGKKLKNNGLWVALGPRREEVDKGQEMRRKRATKYVGVVVHREVKSRCKFGKVVCELLHRGSSRPHWRVDLVRSACELCRLSLNR